MEFLSSTIGDGGAALRVSEDLKLFVPFSKKMEVIKSLIIICRHERPPCCPVPIKAKLVLQVVFPLDERPAVLNGEDGRLALAIFTLVDGPEVFRPIRGLRFNVDFFELEICDIVVISHLATV